MNTLFHYLSVSALSITVLYVIYWFFLRRDTFFQMNRFYLLATIIFSMLLPLFPFHWIPANPVSSVVVFLEPVLITPAKVEKTILDHLQWIEIAAVVYFTGIIIFCLRFGLQLFQLTRIARRFGIRKLNGQRVVFVDRGYAPFSFFNLVFINEASVPPESLPTILEHERVHVRQYHSLDMILVEIATILQWFNPVVWLAGREMKTLHEYLADEGVLQNGISLPTYQQMILNETMGIQVNNLTNNFNVSLLKKRIAMMTKSKSKTWAKGKMLIALPVVLVMFFMLTARSYSTADVLKPMDNPVVTGIYLTAGPAPVPQDHPKQEKQVKYVPVKTDKEVFTVVEQQPVFPGGQEGYRTFLIDNIKYPAEALKKKVMGTVYITFVIEKDGSVRDAKILRGIGSGCDEEALRVVKMMPNWNPGLQKGKPVAVQYNLPIKFKLDKGKKEEPKK